MASGYSKEEATLTVTKCQQCGQVFRSERRRLHHQQRSMCGSIGYYSSLDEVICEICKNLNVRGLYGHRIPFKDLLWSADDGCSFCKLALQGITSCGLGTEKIEEITWPSDYDNYVYVLTRADKIALDFFRLADSNSMKIKLPVRALHSEDTGSEEAFQMAMGWLNSCKDEHTACGNSIEQRLPSRVLDLQPTLGTAFTGPSLDIRLYETSGEIGQYACLSHCWGEKQPLMTTRTNLVRFRDHISWELLPKTFQDAINFTRRLRIRYLWIDSLCIVQNDEEDWQREAGRMYSTYENSYLTIAATKSFNAHEGCFSIAHSSHKSHFLDASNNIPDIGKVYARKVLSHWAFEDPEDSLVRLPLLARGWVYQERLLSPRVLHFAADELIWECMEAICCECQPLFTDSFSSDPLESSPKIAHRHCLPNIRPPRSNWEPQQPSRRARRWHDVVKEYSRLNLSLTRDRLPALAGVATQMKVLTGDEYLAGLWQSSLFEDLLWYVEDATALKDDHRLPVPSWSWASLMAPISYADLNDASTLDLKVTLLEALCTPATHYSTGGIVSGRLKISGKLLRSNVEKFARGERPYQQEYAVRVNGKYLDNFYNDGQLNLELNTEIFCLLIARHQIKIEMSSDLEYPSFFEMPEEITNFGLVLTPIDSEISIFRRIGYFGHVVSSHGNFTGVRDEFSAAKEQNITII